MKCSIASGSSSSQKPAFFSITLQSWSMIHRHTEIWKWQGSASASPLMLEICRYLSKWASALLELQWLLQSLREPLVWSHHLKRLLQGTWTLLQCPTSVLLPLSLSGCHWHCLSSVLSSLHWSPSSTLCRFCRDFLLELLAPALSQLAHLCHRQTADW